MTTSLSTILLQRPLDEPTLRSEFSAAAPFPHIALDDFLEPGFAAEVAAAFPEFEDARRRGREFRAVNERGKVQVTDASAYPEPLRRLAELMASPELLASLGRITGIEKLLADDDLVGGGIHLMASGAHLDVHVDFNRIEDRDLHRRLNVLLFLQPDWREEWGGELELWDDRVRHCARVFQPRFNRLVLFETSEHSFHGVRAVTTPPGVCRQSFAAYYYTTEAPDEWVGVSHSTVFRARPDEWWKGRVLMPAERALWSARRAVRRLRRRLRAG